MKKYYPILILFIVIQPPTFSQESDNTTLIGRWGQGACHAVAVSGNLAFIGSGSILEIIDYSDPTNILLIGELLLPSFINDIAVEDNYVFIADNSNRLTIVDVTNPADPVEIGNSQVDHNAWFVNALSVAVEDNYVYLGDFWLWNYDVTDPTAPVVSDYLNSPLHIQDLTIYNDKVYLAASGEFCCFWIVDITDPTNLVHLGQYSPPGSFVNYSSYGVAVSGNYAYVAFGDDGLRIFDITDPTAPDSVSFMETNGFARRTAISGNHVLLGDGWDGLKIIDVNNPDLPVEVGHFNTDGDIWDIAVNNNITLIADDWNGLRIIDISNVETPEEVGYYNSGGGVATGVAVSENYVYVASGTAGLYILDIEDPASPIELGYFNTEGTAWKVATNNNYSYVAAGSGGLRIIDVSDPTNPFEVGNFDTEGYSHHVAVNENYAYLADESADLIIIDVTNPDSPVELGSYNTEGGGARYVSVIGNYAYVADRSEGLRIIDISDPNNPIEVGIWDGGGSSVTVRGDYAYVGANGLYIINISDPSAPIQVGVWRDGPNARSVAVNGNYAYLATNNSGLYILDITDPSNPVRVAYYDTNGYAWHVAVNDNFAFIADGNDGLYIIQNDLLLNTDEESSHFPENFLLAPNYPNPFNPITTISYQLPKSVFVNLSIYNVAGQLVETILNENKNAGYHYIDWNASDAGSGIYFYKITADNYTEVRKCIIVK